ncbi:nitroreductase/quinone reductase family protein [Actinoplanes sp. URMC 104]|uniref:nitroreductase/quinone reductase family protein n=1 Tax=Actinoplanes sp. URMC 104 TaxID=3423409 RepID=UPI003F1C4D99
MAGIYARTMQRVGHSRWFAVAVKHAGCKVDRVLFRATGGRWTMGGRDAPIMLLTTRGRRTGKDRTVPLLFVRDGERLVAACENFGLQTASSWPFNLRAHPYATIQVGSRTGHYRARPATPDECDRYVPRLVADWPAHETYRRRSGVRHVFVFEPVASPPPGRPGA